MSNEAAVGTKGKTEKETIIDVMKSMQRRISELETNNEILTKHIQRLNEVALRHGEMLETVFEVLTDSSPVIY